VRINGRDVAEMSKNERARLRRQSIGYVFQDLNLLAGLSAVENVSLPLELDGVGLKEARVAAMAALERMGMEARADRFPDQLSGGERQRVAVARSVVGNRDILLADEPTGALDSVNGEGVMRLLRAACQQGVAGIVVTHDAQLASWAHRVIFLRDGRVVDQTMAAPSVETLLAGDGVVP
jgi:putative ABC transport system ATP-binding protein